TVAQGSTLSGNTVYVQGQNITIEGSNVVSTQGTLLQADNDINIIAASSTRQESQLRDEKKSGLLSGGGVAVTIGSQQMSTDHKGVQTTAVGSTVGSVEGDVAIMAGNKYTQTGSDVLAPGGDIDIRARKVDIDEARESGSDAVQTKFKQSGLTIALSTPVLNAMQTAQQMGQAAGNTDDGRMQLLAGASAALAGKNALDAVRAGQGITVNGKPNQIQTGTGADNQPTYTDANAADKAGGVSISISVGASKSQSDSTQKSDTAAGSSVEAGGKVSIRATGGGQDSNLTIQGSAVRGNDVYLKADNKINLLAAENTAEQHSSNKSSSASVGVAVSLGSNTGIGFTASASAARGNADGADHTYTNTHVEASNRLVMESGGDTNIVGAVASGRQVKADIGGELNIESLQDTSVFDSKQQSIGGSVMIGAGGGGSFSYSKSKIDSDYASVAEQSAIRAGEGGFDITVKGHTDLKGGAITSTQAAVDEGRNHFESATLATSDIDNHASYSAESIGVGLGTGGGKAMLTGGIGVGSDSRSASSTTQAAISGYAGDSQARTGDKESGIAPIFDQDKTQKEIDAQVLITQQFGANAAKAVGDYASDKTKELRQQASQETDPTRQQELLAEAQKWDEGGAYRVLAHTAIGALTGDAGGALGAGASALAAPGIDELTSALPAGVREAVGAGIAAGLGAATGGTAGAASAFNAEVNNRQLHQTERDWAKANVDKYRQYIADKTGTDITSEQAYQQLLTAGYELVDYAAESYPDNLDPGIDKLAKQFIVANTTGADLFVATAAEKANPTLYGNADGSKTPEQQALSGRKTPGEKASAAVTRANEYIGQPCGTNCKDKFESIDNAIGALQEARVLYQDDPGSVRLIDSQIDLLRQGMTADELARGSAQSIADKDKMVAEVLLGSPTSVVMGSEVKGTIAAIESAVTKGETVATGGAVAAKGGIGAGETATGTVFDSIKATQPTYPGSTIPRSFELTLPNGQTVWVAGNATEHMAEFAAGKAVNFTPEAVNLASQAQMTSLQSAVNTATLNGVPYNQLINVGGWELKFAPPRQAGQLPSLIHALQK
ncbi:MAG: hemagglutinin repeat-containing protein, partial [Desulfovibrionaceae bacterium]|nr:hemagglutinin repeat-containing protein [Desulfovibrionaceae bacterium]